MTPISLHTRLAPVAHLGVKADAPDTQHLDELITPKKGWFASTKAEGTGRQRPGLILMDELELRDGEPALDFVEAMLEGSCPAPTYVLTLAVLGTALHLAFDALEPLARAHLARARKDALVNLTLLFGARGGTSPCKQLRLSSQMWERQRGKPYVGAEEWVRHVTRLIPGVPAAMAEGLPRLRDIADHRVFLMQPMTPAAASKLGLAVQMR